MEKPIPSEWTNTISTGNIGELAAKKWAESINLSYTPATRMENLCSGIDCYIADVPTDVKNTKKTFFAKFVNGRFFCRHPFRPDTKATHYCILNDDLSLHYWGSIDKYLIENYFETESRLKKFKALIADQDDKMPHQVKKDFKEPFQLLNETKVKVLRLVNSDTYCSFDLKQDVLEYSFTLARKEDVPKYTRHYY